MQNKRAAFICTFCLWLSVNISVTQAAEIRDQFERITPAQAGYSEAKLKQLSEYLEQHGSSSMMLLHDGKVFFQWGDIYQPHTVHSIRKALLNSLLGIYHNKGVLALDKSLADYNIDDLSPLSSIEKSATLRQLLQSRSGVYHDAAADSPGMRNSRPKRHSHKPGEAYYYNNWSFNVAGAILEQQTNQSVYQLFLQHIAKPLGMQYRADVTRLVEGAELAIQNTDGFYYYEPSRSKYPAYHFRLSTYDLALYGQLYLNRGRWQGKQIVPQDWIDLTTRPHSVYNEKYGLSYGMFWSVLVNNKDDVDPPAFYHTGTGVHMLGVYPKHKLVMVHRVATEQEYQFQASDLYPLIKLMHQARIVAE
ncbi:MAG: serine hydrolase [Gammaproteobacteria bacterium]|nr:serine hydrolase [Gammaproteobacteria bacterium]